MYFKNIKWFNKDLMDLTLEVYQFVSVKYHFILYFSLSILYLKYV